MLQVTILGCGPSLGVPVIGCECSICNSETSFNKRTRSAITIQGNDTTILVDFGFDIKDQLIREKVKYLDGAILTHDHADHVGGIDNLRIFSLLYKKPLDIFTDAYTATIISERYKYLFATNQLKINSFSFFEKFKINNLEVKFFQQAHGRVNSLGVRIQDFVYSTDVANFPKESEQFLYNIKIWILDCWGYVSTSCHSGLDKVLQWNEKYKPQQIFLTNMNHNIDYHAISKELPGNITPLYDGFRFTV